MLGGLTAAVVALPLALAFGVASGMGAVAGLYGAIVLGILAACLGGTPAQISGPTGPMTVVVAGIVASHGANPGVVVSMVVLAGLLQAALGLFRLGGYVRFLPYPVISGFMSGIGIIVMALQMLPLLGVKGAVSVVEALRALPAAIAAVNPAALALGLGAIACVYGVPRLTRAVPASLVALLVMTAVSLVLGLDVPRIGSIPSGLPHLNLPTLDAALLGTVLGPAFTLAILAAIDSLLTSLVADQLTRDRHDSDRELIGQGVGNALVGLVGGVPGAGATMRTVVNIRSGGRGRLSGVTHGVVLLAILLGLGRWAAWVPLSVLAGILLPVGVGILDRRGIRHFFRVPRADAAVMVVVLVVTVFIDLIQAVGFGMVLASLLHVKRMSELPVGRVATLPLDDEILVVLPSEERPGSPAPEVRRGAGILHLEGMITFANADRLARSVEELGTVRAVVLDMKRVAWIDQSAAYTLSDLLIDLERAGRPVHIANLGDQPARLLRLTGIVPGDLGADRLHPSVEAALEALQVRS